MRLPYSIPSRPIQGNFDNLVRRLGFERVTIGRANVTWPGGSALSNMVTVPHGLGSSPRSVVATPNDEAGSGRVGVVAFFDATSVTIHLENTAGSVVAGTTVTPVSWAAYA